MFLLYNCGSAILAAVLAMTLFLCLVAKKYPFIGRVWLIPTFGPHHLLVGHLITAWKNREDLTSYAMSVSRQWHEKGFVIIWTFYYPVVGIFSWKHSEIIISPLLSIMMLNYHYHQKILRNKKFLDHGWPSRKLDHGFVSLISLAGQEWRARRNMVAPSFGLSILTSFIPTILHHVELMLVDLKATNGSVTLVRPIVQKHVTSVTLETSFGLERGSDDSIRKELIRAVSNFIDSQFDRIFRFYTWNDQMLKIYNWLYGIKDERNNLRRCAREIIEARHAARREYTLENGIDNTSKLRARNQAFLDNMLDNFTDENSLKNKDVENLTGELIIIAWTSIETITNSASWFFYNMAHNPDIQEKLYHELLDFDEKNENMTIAQLNQLTYLDQCVLENLRIYPPSANAVRVIDEDVELDGHLIPKGIFSTTFIYGIHRDEEIYPDPEKFDPSRFEPENFAKIPPGAFIPFGDGPRRCIGERLAILESKIIFSNIIKTFKIELVDKDPAQVNFDLVTRPKKPLEFRFIPRS